jgi:hypothetical protein
LVKENPIKNWKSRCNNWLQVCHFSLAINSQQGVMEVIGFAMKLATTTMIVGLGTWWALGM